MSFVIAHRDYVHCRPYNTPSHLQLGVPQTHRPASGKQSRNSLQNFQHLLHTESYKLTCVTCASTGWLSNITCCASRQSTQTLPPNHLIRHPSARTCRTDHHAVATASAPGHNVPWAHIHQAHHNLLVPANPNCVASTMKTGRFRPIVRSQPLAAQLLRDASERATKESTNKQRMGTTIRRTPGRDLNWVVLPLGRRGAAGTDDISSRRLPCRVAADTSQRETQSRHAACCCGTARTRNAGPCSLEAR